MEGKIVDLLGEIETLKQAQSGDTLAQHEKHQAERNEAAQKIRDLEYQNEQLESKNKSAQSEGKDASERLAKIEQSQQELKSEVQTLRKNKGNPMANAMQKQMIAALREENKMLKD